MVGAGGSQILKLGKFRISTDVAIEVVYEHRSEYSASSLYSATLVCTAGFLSQQSWVSFGPVVCTEP
jgi:hypothetical protein